MRRTSLADFHCSVARTADVIAEWWTPLIVRDAFYGRTRFEEFQQSLGLARNVLAARLGRLVEAGIMERRPYEEHPPRHEYVLTEKGRDLFPIIAAMLAWGDKWTAGEAGPPLLHRHKACGCDFVPVMTCSECAEPLGAREVEVRAGPGA